MSDSQKKRYDSWTDADRKAHGERSAETAVGYKWSDEAKSAFSQKQWTKPNGAKFTADDILNIRMKFEQGFSREELAELYSTTAAYITSIIKRRRWAHI